MIVKEETKRKKSTVKGKEGTSRCGRYHISFL